MTTLEKDIIYFWNYFVKIATGRKISPYKLRNIKLSNFIKYLIKYYASILLSNSYCSVRIRGEKLWSSLSMAGNYDIQRIS